MKPPRPERRAEALSRDAIVDAAIAILDAQGESALTFRALAARLATGSGALYWHVAGKQELLAAAADRVVAQAVTRLDGAADARAAVRALAGGLFDAFIAHPWMGAQLGSDPRQPAMLRIFEGVGGRLGALGVPAGARFNAWSALVNYMLGVAGQNAANARRKPAAEDRAAFLAEVAGTWARLDADTHPFLREVAQEIAVHDDREQFLAGVDLILAGIGASLKG